MNVLKAERIQAAGPRGSSRPLVVDTAAGARLVKLRGAAQGTGPLVAEIIVAELAEALGLHVPPRSLVMMADGIETADWDQELADLLAASVGMNLGFDFLPDAREIDAAGIARIPPSVRTATLWLDRLVLNPDRTAANPNVLWWADQAWLIDHGAALGFQYSWENVFETSPRDPRLPPEGHLFDDVVSNDELRAADAELASRLTRPVLEGATAAVPDSFLIPLLSDTTAEPARVELAAARRRAAYVAYLWKRLQEPRPFLDPQPARVKRPSQRPAWLTRPRS